MIDQTQTTLYPGGILNTGFAYAWAQERMAQARPADPADPNNGAQPWAVQRIADGDTTCRDNQVLHPEAADLEQKIRDNDHYVPEVADPLSPITFVDKINVPVFMACQFTDEQTGGHCPTLAEHMTGTDKKWFTYTNGTHVDSLDPETYNRLYDFFNIYVGAAGGSARPDGLHPGHRAGRLPGDLRNQRAMSGGQCAPPAMTLPPDTIQAQPTYRPRQGGVRGAAADPRPVRQRRRQLEQSRLALSGHSSSRSRAFPIPGTTARSWYLAPGGALADAPATGTRADAFTWDAHARPLTDFTGDTGGGPGGLWTATPNYQWSQDPARHAVAYVTAAAQRRTRPWSAPARVDLWVRSSDAQRRPAGDDQRGPAGRQGDLRAERLGASQRASARRGQEHASSSRFSACARRTSRRCPPTTSCRSRSRSTTRGTPIARARASASGSRRPTATSRSGRSARPSPPERRRSRSATATGCRPASSSRWCRASTVPAQLPPCPGLRGEPCRDYVPFAERHLRPRRLPPPQGRDAVFASRSSTAYNSARRPTARTARRSASGSCTPPDQAPSYLTVGTPDANGQAANSIGACVFDVTPATRHPTRPTWRIASASPTCAARADLADYTGELDAGQTLRITDRQNGSTRTSQPRSATSPSRFAVPCTGTAATTVGATCAITTTVDSILPGAVSEGKRAIWELGQSRSSTAAPTAWRPPRTTRLFARQGIFVP